MDIILIIAILTLTSIIILYFPILKLHTWRSLPYFHKFTSPIKQHVQDIVDILNDHKPGNAILKLMSENKNMMKGRFLEYQALNDDNLSPKMFLRSTYQQLLENRIFLEYAPYAKIIFINTTLMGGLHTNFHHNTLISNKTS